MMKSIRSTTGLLLCLTVVTLPGCTPSDDADMAPDDVAAPRVYVVNYPLQFFAERIGGERIEVVFPAPAEGDPAYWRPATEDILAYQQASLILLNGAGYAQWIEGASLPANRTVNTSLAFADRYIELDGLVTHSHGAGDEHTHAHVDFNTWLDPQLAAQQAAAVADALCAVLPEHQDELRARRDTLQGELQQLGEQLRELSDGFDQPLLASHPVFNYLARFCGWDLHSVHWEPDQMPEEPQWQELESLLADHPAKWMIWEDEPLAEVRERLGQLGVGCVVFRTCGNTPVEGDYLEVMRANLVNLEPALKPPSSEPVEESP